MSGSLSLLLINVWTKFKILYSCMSGIGSVLNVLCKFPTGVLIDWFCKIRNNLLFNINNLDRRPAWNNENAYATLAETPLLKVSEHCSSAEECADLLLRFAMNGRQEALAFPAMDLVRLNSKECIWRQRLQTLLLVSSTIFGVEYSHSIYNILDVNSSFFPIIHVWVSSA